MIAINPNALTIAKQRDEKRRAGSAVPRESLFEIPVLLKDSIGA